MERRGFAANQPDGATVVDDLTTECREDLLLLVSPTAPSSTTRSAPWIAGINGQAVYNGTAGVDRIRGGNDNDTFWGNQGKDIIRVVRRRHRLGGG